MAKQKYVYFFGDGRAEGRGDMKDLLGGKGAGLAEMTNLCIKVPPGFTITTEACIEYYKNNKAYPAGMWDEALEHLKRVEKSMGSKFGDSANPLLVSVRSGAKVSMPGMMDTVLNVGLNDTTVVGLTKKSNNERFAYDAYRRFITMFGSVVMGIERSKFEEILQDKKDALKVREDTGLDAGALKEMVGKYKRLERYTTCRKIWGQRPMWLRWSSGTWGRPQVQVWHLRETLQPGRRGSLASVL